MTRKIIITENQLSELLGTNPVQPRKVLRVKKYLDSSFKKGKMGYISGKGTWEKVPVVGLIGDNGETVKNLTVNQLFYHLQARPFLSEMFTDEKVFNQFLKAVIDAWLKDEIDDYGMIKRNTY
jgi:hypothetical protein